MRKPGQLHCQLRSGKESVATVSRVINQNGRFSKATEKKVLDIIEQYNYQPNQLARSLRVQHSQIIGITVPDISNEFFANITRAVQKHLLKQNYMTIICNTNESGMEARKQIRLVGFDDISISSNIFPSLTTVHQPVEEFGSLAARRIVDMINGKNDIWQQRQRLPVELIVRETT